MLFSNSMISFSFFFCYKHRASHILDSKIIKLVNLTVKIQLQANSIENSSYIFEYVVKLKNITLGLFWPLKTKRHVDLTLKLKFLSK